MKPDAVPAANATPAVPNAGLRVLPRTHSCFVCGKTNPMGLQLAFETDGRIATTRFVPQPHHIGFREVVHGGLLSTVLDEIMVWACTVQTGRFAYAAELTVRFQQPARPGEELVFTAELVSNRRDRIYEARGEVRNPAGQVLATATGKYIPIPPDTVRGMLADFADDTSGVLKEG